MDKINEIEVLFVINKMKCSKVIGPDGLPVEVWKVIRLNEVK